MSEQAENVYTHITPALHPKNVEALESYEQHKGYLAGVLESLSTAYEGMAMIHKARISAAKNPTQNDAGRLLSVANFAEKQQKVITRKIDKTMADLDKGIESLESMLNTPLKAAAAGSSTVPSEIRAHVKALPLEDRGKFLSDAQAAGDVETLAAVLGAPSYLSGVNPAEKTARIRLYHEARSPEVTARLSAMKKGRDLLTERSTLVFKETEKAMGAPWSAVREVLEAKDSSDKAFAVGVE